MGHVRLGQFVYNLVITTTFFPAYYAAVTSLKNFPDGISFLGSVS